MQSPTFSKRFRPPHARVAYFDHTRGRRTGFGGCTRCLTRSGTGHQQRPLAKCTWRFPKVAAAQIQSTNVERNRSRHRGLSYRLDAARPCHYGRLDVPGILRARRDPDLRHILQPRWSWGPLSVRGTALAKHNVDPNAPEQRISKAEIMDDTVLDQSLMERIPATQSERILSDCDDRRIRHFIHFRHDSTGTRKLFFCINFGTAERGTILCAACARWRRSFAEDTQNLQSSIATCHFGTHFVPQNVVLHFHRQRQTNCFWCEIFDTLIHANRGERLDLQNWCCARDGTDSATGHTLSREPMAHTARGSICFDRAPRARLNTTETRKRTHARMRTRTGKGVVCKAISLVGGYFLISLRCFTLHDKHALEMLASSGCLTAGFPTYRLPSLLARGAAGETVSVRRRVYRARAPLYRASRHWPSWSAR